MARRFNPPPLRQNSGWTRKILTWVFPNFSHSPAKYRYGNSYWFSTCEFLDILKQAKFWFSNVAESSVLIQEISDIRFGWLGINQEIKCATKRLCLTGHEIVSGSGLPPPIHRECISGSKKHSTLSNQRVVFQHTNAKTIFHCIPYIFVNGIIFTWCNEILKYFGGIKIFF